jgi:hypothetical protein
MSADVFGHGSLTFQGPVSLRRVMGFLIFSGDNDLSTSQLTRQSYTTMVATLIWPTGQIFESFEVVDRGPATDHREYSLGQGFTRSGVNTVTMM